MKEKNSESVRVMIGSGENSMFLRKKYGERVILEDGTIIRAGETLEESSQRLEDKLDDVTYSKPVAFVKKISRSIRR